MAQIEVTEESLRTAVDEAVFAQAVTLADKVAGFSAVGPQIEAIVDGTEVSVRVNPFGLDAHCACPAPAPCAHAVAAVLTWVRAGPDPATWPTKREAPHGAPLNRRRLRAPQNAITRARNWMPSRRSPPGEFRR